MAQLTPQIIAPVVYQFDYFYRCVGGQIWWYSSIMLGFLRYAAFWIVFAAVGISSVAQTKPLGPPEKGVTKQSGSGNAQESAIPDENKNAPSKVTVIVNQGKPPNGETDEGKSKEDIEIQRKLANFTAGLVIVGIIQAGVLILTWWVMRRQTEIMGQHAEHLSSLAGATRQNVDALIESRRAWIAVAPHETANVTPNSAVFRCWNVGYTPAKLVESVSSYIKIPSLSALPSVPNYNLPKTVENQTLIPSRRDDPDSLLIVARLGLDATEIISVNQGTLLLYYYGRILYKDFIGRERSTAWGYLYHVPLGGDIRPRGFRAEGPAAYNEAS